MNTTMTNQDAEFILSYEFQAPKELVFNTFSTAEALNKWWGPVECKNKVISLDFRPGGMFHFSMEYEGNISYGRFLFTQIRPHDLLEFSNAFADEKANVIKAPFEMRLPDEILYTLNFTETDGKTTIHMTGRPYNTFTAAEREGMLSINEDMQKGFNASFDQLAAYLQQTINH